MINIGTLLKEGKTFFQRKRQNLYFTELDLFCAGNFIYPFQNKVNKNFILSNVYFVFYGKMKIPHKIYAEF